MTLTDAIVAVAYTDRAAVHPAKYRQATEILHAALLRAAKRHFDAQECEDRAGDELMTMIRRAPVNALRLKTSFTSDAQVMSILNKRMRLRAIPVRPQLEEYDDARSSAPIGAADAQTAEDALITAQSGRSDAELRAHLLAAVSLFERAAEAHVARQKRKDARANAADGTRVYVGVMRGDGSMEAHYAAAGDPAQRVVRNRVQQRLSRYRVRFVKDLDGLVEADVIDQAERQTLVGLLRLLGSGKSIEKYYADD